MTGLMRKFGILLVALLLSTPIACSQDSAVPGGSGAQTGSAPPGVQSPTDSPKVSPSLRDPKPTRADSTPPIKTSTHEPPEPEITKAAPALPQEFEGLWTTVGQGSAETVYRFRSDGSYDRVSTLLQDRPSGRFSFVITASGFAVISGNNLTLTPTEGTQVMEDPDSPSSQFNKPLGDLTPDVYLWRFQDGQLILSDELGSVAYTWKPDQ